MGSWREGVGAAEVERGDGDGEFLSESEIYVVYLCSLISLSTFPVMNQGEKKRKGMHEKIEEVEKTHGMHAKMKTRKSNGEDILSLGDLEWGGVTRRLLAIGREARGITPRVCAQGRGAEN